LAIERVAACNSYRLHSELEQPAIITVGKQRTESLRVKYNTLRRGVSPLLTLIAFGTAGAEIVTFEMSDVAVFSSAPPSSIMATTGQQIPGGFDNSSAGNEFHLSSLQFDIDDDLDTMAPDPSIYFDFQVRTAAFAGGQIVFDGFTHAVPPAAENGSYVVTKGENSYLNLPFAEGDLIGDGIDEFIRDGFRPPGPPNNQTFSVALDEGGVVHQFIEGSDNFVGFVLDTGGYGWIRVQFDSTGGDGAGTLMFLDGAYDDTGAPIAAGDIGTSLPLSGDYDGDQDVDGDDYLVWKRDFGLTGGSAADGNNDGVVNAADYVLWRSNAGAGAAGFVVSAAASIPEPSAVFIASWLAVVVAAAHRRRPAREPE
jgi:hypothetical protein